MEHYQIDDVKYSEEDITDSFVANRECFFSQLLNLLKNRDDLSRIEQLKSIDIMTYPDNLIEENGCIIFNYKNDSVLKENIYFYIDKVSSQFCGYTLS